MLILVEMEQSYLEEEWEDIYIFQTELAWNEHERIKLLTEFIYNNFKVSILKIITSKVYKYFLQN